MPLALSSEILGYQCGSCGSNIWRLALGKRSDNKTFLLLSCAHPTCKDQRAQELNTSPEDMIVWAEYDITGQVNTLETTGDMNQ